MFSRDMARRSRFLLAVFPEAVLGALVVVTAVWEMLASTCVGAAAAA
jgi:hypothetical protein